MSRPRRAIVAATVQHRYTLLSSELFVTLVYRDLKVETCMFSVCPPRPGDPPAPKPYTDRLPVTLIPFRRGLR